MSQVKPRPDGMQWINAFLTVKDVAAAIAFYNKAFGFDTRFTMPGPDGKIMHAELSYKDCVIMLGPECPEMKSKSPATLGGSPAGLYIYTEDVDALYARAKAAGATVVAEPVDMFWGDRMCHLFDPDGHNWTFATHIKDVKPEDMHPPTA